MFVIRKDGTGFQGDVPLITVLPASALQDWRRLLSAIPAETGRKKVFAEAALDIASRASNKLDAVDELQRLAAAHLPKATPDEIQAILARAFAKAESEVEEVVDVEEVVPDIDEEEPNDTFEESCLKADEERGRKSKSSGREAGGTAISSEEINKMTFDPIKFVVPGYIVEGLTLFAGKPKIGKSWLLLHAAIAVARGGYTLGDVHCQEGDVLYCALEDNFRRLRSRLEKLLQTQSNWPKRLNFFVELPRLTEGGLAIIKDWIEKAERPRLVVIDTLAMVRMPNRKDQSTYDADYAAVKDLRALANQYGVAIVLVHHLRKAEADDAFDTISGTLGLTGAPDTVMVIRRDTSGTTLHARGRDLTDVEKAVQFDTETCIWTVLGDATEVRRSDQRGTIVEAMAEADEPLGPNQIAAATGMKAVNVRFLLGKLHKEGLVQKVGYGKYTLKRSHSHTSAHTASNTL